MLPVRRYAAINQPSVTVRVPLPQPVSPRQRASPTPAESNETAPAAPSAAKPTFKRMQSSTPHSVILPI